MGRTTSPPPLDITSVFPKLAPLARQAVRLHPRAGAPGRNDSSLGGPLLWPAEQSWPACQEPHYQSERFPVPPEITAWDQAVRWGQAAGVGVLREGDGPIYAERWHYLPPEEPSPLVGVLQLHARDVPELPFPEHTDLFQLLWCPNHHDLPWLGPCPIVVWRRGAEVTKPLSTPPDPRFDEDLFGPDYLPLPCVLHPERVVEYPHPCNLPARYPHPCNLPVELAERIQQWDQRHDRLYWAALSTAPGTKIGGHPRWIQPPAWPVCGCGRRMDHLLTIASDEFAPQGRWLPLEDRDDPKITSRRRRIVDRDAWAPHGLMLGDVGSLYLFTCAACAHRPLAGTMQCS
ncbi:MAG TPA: DUF1963 domain-containing protein [Actinomycetes bacterium]